MVWNGKVGYGEAVGAGCSTLSCVTASRVQAVEACYVVEWLGPVGRFRYVGFW